MTRDIDNKFIPSSVREQWIQQARDNDHGATARDGRVMEEWEECFVYLMQEKIGDGPWETLSYAGGKKYQRALEWSEVCPRSIAIDGFPVYRRLIMVLEWNE